MNNSLKITAVQEQQQKLNLQQQQDLELLVLPFQQLEQELLANPLVVQEDFSDDFLSGEATAAETEDESVYEAEAYENYDDYDKLAQETSAEEMDGLEEFCLSDDGDRSRDQSCNDDFPVFVSEETGTNGWGDYNFVSLTEFRQDLQIELHTCKNLSDEIRTLCSLIIISLDDKGFLISPLSGIASACNASIEKAEKALALVQTFDPPGIAGRTPQESLLLQLRRKGEATPEFERLLTELSEDLANNKIQKICKTLGIAEYQLENMLKKLSRLSPYPITVFSEKKVYIEPDVEIIPAGTGRFVAFLANEKTFRLSDLAMENRKKETVEFEKKAKGLIHSWNFWRNRVLNFARMLIATQEAFLHSGKSYLQPLTMAQAAEFLGTSTSTVSRTAKDKYIKTPHGVFPLIYFFSAGYVNEEGETISRTSDKERLQKLIDNEDKRKPLSDEKLAALLNQAGHCVARRTVVKYRKLLGIPNSSSRKKFF